MVQTIIKYIMLAAVAGIAYFFMSHHILFFGKEPVLLKKSEITFSETFVNIVIDDLTTPLALMRKHPETRRDGLGEVLVDRGIITIEELSAIETQLDAEEQNW